MNRFRFIIPILGMLLTLAMQAKTVYSHVFVSLNSEPGVSSDDSTSATNDLFRYGHKRLLFKSTSKTTGKSFSPSRIWFDDNDDDDGTELACFSEYFSTQCVDPSRTSVSLDWLARSFARRSKSLRL